jgi:arsenate reductase
MTPDGPIRVLFVCTGNSARSQLAEALLMRAGGPDFEAASAGTEPKGVHPLTVRVLAELGIDWGSARSTAVTEVTGRSWDHVITVCDRARQACPVFPGRPATAHWDLEDPAEVRGTDAERLTAFRDTRDAIERRLAGFVPAALTGRRVAQASSSRST